MSDVDLGWEDVVRRARRSRRRLWLVTALVAVVGAGSVLGVALTQSASAVRLPLDKIGGTQIVTIIDPHTRHTILVVGRWRAHDGVCFLLPRIRAGCLRHGQRLRLPFFRRAPRLGASLFVRRAAAIELLDARGRVIEKITLGR